MTEKVSDASWPTEQSGDDDMDFFNSRLRVITQAPQSAALSFRLEAGVSTHQAGVLVQTTEQQCETESPAVNVPGRAQRQLLSKPSCWVGFERSALN